MLVTGTTLPTLHEQATATLNALMAQRRSKQVVCCMDNERLRHTEYQSDRRSPQRDRDGGVGQEWFLAASHSLCGGPTLWWAPAWTRHDLLAG